MVPSLKGLAIAGLVADLNALESGGASTRDELAKHLDSDQLAVLDDFDGFRWYPVPIYEALVEALVRLTGTADAGTSPWLRARGAAAAQRLLERGLYQQLNSLTETDSWTTENQISRVRMIASLQGSLLNFTVWKVDVDPDYPQRAQMTLTGAADYPDRLRLVTEGFIEACSQVAQSNALWRSERVSPDCIIFRADRDFGN